MGRAPTSGYCETCRKRRIKCDKTAPSCMRCLKSGYVCKGYASGLRIQSLVVVTGSEGSQRLARLAGPSDASSNQRRNDPRRLNPPQGLNLTAFQEHMAFSYFFATYGWACFWKPFLQLAKENDLAPTASHICSLALAYGHMGLGHGDKGLKSMGLELYGRSLREVQTLLSQGGAARTELARLCVPVVILGMYSVYLRLIHNLGVVQILKHCGPEAFQDEPLLTAYRSCRALLSFAVRRRTFMEEFKWKTVPWQKLPKTALDRLIDILADMPGIVNDMAASERPISPATKASFRSQVGKLRTAIQAWRHDWDRANPGAGSEAPSHLKMDNIDSALFREQLSTTIEFGTTQQALEMLTYNAGLIYLMQLEDILSIGKPHSSPITTEIAKEIRRDSLNRHPSQPLLLPEEVRHTCQPALEAFRLIPSLYKNLVTTRDRVMVILAPLGIVYCSTKGQPGLSKCMEAVLDEIPFFGSGATRDLSVYELKVGEAWRSGK
ncbi:hypothetical protein M406DRAFT_291222 [Cryphonectria parasitica EP155]|uniref:Zn(2)-C6 fungal-type domain-containing protein n=1 Tax=Cryphonectria parasitica (strain ATCC 38755 / EP155) TaxID=660469 RepID=A0A9P4Y0J6_CRYP1|nr:uncharacterized protein M406DRAFT_291222 [Cryphonectria parasitica EP155]KAF3764170.1 hypothetical protein M406DRAFT_291222 [Cryphonectria parasitica EP155]